jgi:hypothetical protein
MTAALVGLIGVIVGGLLGGVASDIVERRVRRRSADAAGRVIAAELALAYARLNGAADAGEWWSGTLPTAAWRDHFAALAAEAPDDLIGELATAYALLESWNDEGESARVANTNPATEDFRKDAVTARQAKEALVRFTRAGDDSGARKLVLSTAAVAIAVAAFVLGVVLLVPRPNVNADTVAAAVEEAYGPRSLAECDPAADDWACTVYPLAQDRSACLSANTRASPLTVASAEAADTTDSCAASQTATPEKVSVARSGEDLVFYEVPPPKKTAGQAERDIIRSRPDRTHAQPERSLVGRAWRQLWGLRANGRD